MTDGLLDLIGSKPVLDEVDCLFNTGVFSTSSSSSSYSKVRFLLRLVFPTGFVFATNCDLGRGSKNTIVRIKLIIKMRKSLPRIDRNQN
jgi:hypothetical protein